MSTILGKRWALRDAATDGGEGGGAAADTKGAADDGKGAAAASSGAAPDWRAAIAGDDATVLEQLKGIEDPKVLVQSHLAATNWRQTLAGENADDTKTLERFASPKAMWDSYKELRGKVSKGELKLVTPFPEKGSDEEKAAWREQNGVPKDGKYEITAKLDDSVKPLVDNFTAYAHEKNLPASAVNEVVNWWASEQAKRQEAMAQQFEKDKTETAALLGSEWGPEYKANINKIQGVLDATIPADQTQLKTLVMNGILTNPHFARHYAAIALQLNPAGTMVPGDAGANEATIVDEIKKIEDTMRSNRTKYDQDAGMQKKYRDLLGAYQRLSGKEWGR